MNNILDKMCSMFEKELLNYASKNIYPGGRYRRLWIRDSMFIAKTLIKLNHLHYAKTILQKICNYQLLENSNSSKVVHMRGLTTKPLCKSAIKVGHNFLSKNVGAFPTTVFSNGTLDFYGKNPDIDSTALWIITMCNYVVKSGDIEFGKRVYHNITMALSYLKSRDVDKDYLVEQGPNEDWADCILRSGKVSYSNALWFGAVNKSEELERLLGNGKKAKNLKSLKEKIRSSINKKLWLENKGYYADYIADKRISDHISQDTSLMIVFDIADSKKSKTLLKTFEENSWNRFGSLTFYPPYKKILPKLNYQNSKIWPWICGFEISARAKVGDINNAINLLARVYPYHKYEWISKNGSPHGANPFFTGIASLLEASYELKRTMIESGKIPCLSG